MPQARHAPAIAKIPAPPPFGPPPRQDNKSAPPRIAAAPTNSRLSPFSRKTSQAIASVARPSRLSSSEIGRAHVCTPVPNAQLVCRLLHEKKKRTNTDNHPTQ